MTETTADFDEASGPKEFNVAADPVLLECLRRSEAGWAETDVRALGQRADADHVRRWARQVEEFSPILRTYDRYGRRIDEVVFHPSWHRLMSAGVGAGLGAAPWTQGRPGAHVARAAKAFVWRQVEPGHMWPLETTYAVVPTLRHEPALAARFEPLLTTPDYDNGLRAPESKRGLLATVSMGENKGDVGIRSITTSAFPTDDGTYLLTGRKVFTPAPTCDLFLVLAQTPGGLSCFLVPRVLPDNTRNRIHLVRFNDALGNRANALAEIEYNGAVAWPVGEEGSGATTISELVAMTRFNCILSTASGMRAGLTQAVHHVAYRHSTGQRLSHQPLMTNVLTDLAIETEAAITAVLHLAGATDHAAAGHVQQAAFRRLALVVCNYWICKRGSAHVTAILDCLGGNGHLEESGIPKIYREMSMHPVRAGSGNLAAREALRVITKRPESLDAFFAELGQARGADRHLDAAVHSLHHTLRDPQQTQWRAGRILELMALTLQGTLLVQQGNPAVADAFISSRLGGDWDGTFGTLPNKPDTRTIIGRAMAPLLDTEWTGPTLVRPDSNANT
ncbi:acyl-CoA dehydrogenase family protein [Nocardia gipuzkoensis]|uniref:acyl-CoA dehydrogenase family protein n=1 Tax=Nocardia gipuzkoensis TaxID=2749991 RepID=UPI00237D8AAA|nr:acyl-CoA dehydrogenase family protein [Nocardia gipuzkoensis]MDE1675325.1 acyl-CoA dehydrogenase family protein [Nocardia gipuzkoensis]